MSGGAELANRHCASRTRRSSSLRKTGCGSSIERLRARGAGEAHGPQGRKLTQGAVLTTDVWVQRHRFFFQIQRAGESIRPLRRRVQTNEREIARWDRNINDTRSKYKF